MRNILGKIYFGNYLFANFSQLLVFFERGRINVYLPADATAVTASVGNTCEVLILGRRKNLHYLFLLGHSRCAEIKKGTVFFHNASYFL